MQSPSPRHLCRILLKKQPYQYLPAFSVFLHRFEVPLTDRCSSYNMQQRQPLMYRIQLLLLPLLPWKIFSAFYLPYFLPPMIFVRRMPIHQTPFYTSLYSSSAHSSFNTFFKSVRPLDNRTFTLLTLVCSISDISRIFQSSY